MSAGISSPHAKQLAALLVALACLALLGDHASARQQNAPKHQGHTSEGVVKLRTPGPQRILIRGGVFRMGSDIPEVAIAQAVCRLEPLKKACNTRLFTEELVAHTVKVSDFWIDRTEVTTGAYKRCVDTGVCAAPGYGAASSWNAKPRYPVTLVSWYDARRYCGWIGGRLPTEAEWERAARGWKQRNYPWGNIFNKKLCNHGRFAAHPLDKSDGFAERAPVGSFPLGRTREGVYDMAGNVEEWVADWYANQYPEADMVNPVGPSAGDERVIRGGSYRSGRAWLRNAARYHDLPSTRRAWRGFRCAYNATPKLRPNKDKPSP